MLQCYNVTMATLTTLSEFIAWHQKIQTPQVNNTWISPSMRRRNHGLLWQWCTHERHIQETEERNRWINEQIVQPQVSSAGTWPNLQDWWVQGCDRTVSGVMAHQNGSDKMKKGSITANKNIDIKKFHEILSLYLFCNNLAPLIQHSITTTVKPVQTNTQGTGLVNNFLSSLQYCHEIWIVNIWKIYFYCKCKFNVQDSSWSCTTAPESVCEIVLWSRH